MTEKRDMKRKKKRLKLRFGTDYPKRVAFTDDISIDGLFIITGQPERPGAELLIELTLPSEESVIARARVRWAKRVPPNLIRLASKAGMGVIFLKIESGAQAYAAYIDELRR